MDALFATPYVPENIDALKLAALYFDRIFIQQRTLLEARLDPNLRAADGRPGLRVANVLQLVDEPFLATLRPLLDEGVLIVRPESSAPQLGSFLHEALKNLVEQSRDLLAHPISEPSDGSSGTYRFEEAALAVHRKLAGPVGGTFPTFTWPRRAVLCSPCPAGDPYCDAPLVLPADIGALCTPIPLPPDSPVASTHDMYTADNRTLWIAALSSGIHRWDISDLSGSGPVHLDEHTYGYLNPAPPETFVCDEPTDTPPVGWSCPSGTVMEQPFTHSVWLTDATDLIGRPILLTTDEKAGGPFNLGGHLIAWSVKAPGSVPSLQPYAEYQSPSCATVPVDRDVHQVVARKDMIYLSNNKQGARVVCRRGCDNLREVGYHDAPLVPELASTDGTWCHQVLPLI